MKYLNSFLGLAGFIAFTLIIYFSPLAHASNEKVDTLALIYERKIYYDYSKKVGWSMSFDPEMKDRVSSKDFFTAIKDFHKEVIIQAAAVSVDTAL